MKKAFTLIELLVVIGILAILCGVLIAALSGSTDAAKGAKCLANLHSLAMGVQSRAMSAHSFPFAGTIVKQHDISMRKQDVVHGWIGWSENSTSGSYISPYNQGWDARNNSLTNGAIWQAVSENAEIFVCPLHREAFMKKNPSAKYGPCWSYVMNAKFKWASQTKPFPHTYASWPYDALGNKSKTLMFAELPFLRNEIVSDVQFNAGGEKENDPVLHYPGCNGGGDEMIAFNHKTGKREVYAHVCYADGHTDKLVLPRNASEGNIKDLTKWLCDPGQNFDVVLEGNQYRKLEN